MIIDRRNLLFLLTGVAASRAVAQSPPQTTQQKKTDAATRQVPTSGSTGQGQPPDGTKAKKDEVQPSGKKAILVGVSNWPQDSGFRPLEGVSADIEGLAKSLMSLGIVVEVLKNSAATKENVLRAIGQSPHHSLLLVHFASHGLSISDKKANPRNIVALEGTNLANLRTTGLFVDDVASAIRVSNAEQALITLDVCRVDALTEKGAVDRGTDSDISESFAIGSTDISPRGTESAPIVNLIYGAQQGHRVYEDVSGGVFSRSLAEQLVSPTNSRDIRLRPVLAAVDTRVAQWHGSHGESQKISYPADLPDLALGRLDDGFRTCPATVANICNGEAWVAFPTDERYVFQRVSMNDFVIYDGKAEKRLAYLNPIDKNDPNRLKGTMKIGTDVVPVELVFEGIGATLTYRTKPVVQIAAADPAPMNTNAAKAVSPSKRKGSGPEGCETASAKAVPQLVEAVIKLLPAKTLIERKSGQVTA